MFKMFLPANNCVNQAIQPRVVGPLCTKKGIGCLLLTNFGGVLGPLQSDELAPGKKGYAQFLRACFFGLVAGPKRSHVIQMHTCL